MLFPYPIISMYPFQALAITYDRMLEGGRRARHSVLTAAVWSKNPAMVKDVLECAKNNLSQDQVRA